MRLPYFLLRMLPMWDYICPKCKREVEPTSRKCPYCNENYGVPLRVPPKVLKDKKALEEYVHKYVFPKVSARQREYLAQYFTVIFEDGFESGDFSAWSSTYVDSGCTLQVKTNNPYRGIYNAEAYLSALYKGAYCRKNITAAPVIYTRGYYKVSALPTASNHHLPLNEIWYNNYQNSVAACIGYSGGKAVWELFDYINGTAYHTYDTVGPEIGKWYCVEILRDVTNGKTKLWIDGVLRLDVNEAHVGNCNVVTHGVVWTYYAPAYVYFDCCVIADTYIGPEGGEIVKQWSQPLNLVHVFSRPLRFLRLAQALSLTHVFRRPIRLLKLTQTLRTVHTWTVRYPGVILKQWFATVQTAHVFKRPFRRINYSQTLRTIHALALKRFFRLTQTLRLTHVLRRPFRRIGYTQQVETLHVYGRPVRVVRLPAVLRLSHVLNRPYRLLRLSERLHLSHAYFVAVPGAKKTRLYLVIGDLAIQLTSD